MEDRIVITGMGAVTPLGLDADATWASLAEGRSGVGEIRSFDAAGLSTRIAAEVTGFDPTTVLSVKRANRSSRASQFAVAAAQEAVADAGLGTDLSEVEAAVSINSAVAGFEEVQRATEHVTSGRAQRIAPSFVPSALANMPACEVAIDLGVHGPVNASALACASGTHALLEARKTLLANEAEVVLAGGTDASITSVMFAGLGAMKAMSRRNDAPSEASRPFDADRDGFVFGEGAVVFAVERLSSARERGAHIYAEILGGAMTSDAFNIVAPEPTGAYASRAISRALDASRLDPADVDLVCAHGTSTKANDRTESRAVEEAFGAAAHDVPVTAPKSMTGHLIGAAGALAALLCVRAVEDGVIPPVLNYTTPDPECRLDYVAGSSREGTVRTAITNAFGFGGQNCVVTFGAVGS